MSADRTAALRRLRDPFPPEQIGKLPRNLDEAGRKTACKVCGGYHKPAALHLDYVGHAETTARLLDADPEWTWEPVSDPAAKGLPTIPGSMWIALTVAGVTRYGFGSVAGKTGGDAVKEVIGDAIRNAAMRFGVALDLWAKSDLHATATPATEPVVTTASAEPDPDAPAVTEDAWFDGFNARIEACANLPKLRGLWSELRSQEKARQVSPEDFDGLSGILKARAEELAGAAVATTPEPVGA